MLKPEDQRAYDAAVAELNEATEELQRLSDDPAATLASLARAQHRYDLSRVQWLRCEWQLRASAAHALPEPPSVVAPIVIVGHTKAIRDSLATLLNVHGYQPSESLGFDDCNEICIQPPQVIVLDVSDSGFSRDASAWLIESIDTARERPRIIALVWPTDSQAFTSKVDEVIAKPKVFKKLLDVLERINSDIEALRASRITADRSGPNGAAIVDMPSPY
ncbi:MAG TPA: response regulator receiver protein [Paraburkholderia sp.]|uniref:response regulator receiver protein n=1 Tax=Paraburkholderia sp. TaxID=1926495 RepID=UPI002B4A2359|nr:response regulator receiver protein [Paraburkholderia sp.]HKR44550.1 response regulator receiver protein [Paraburkholderia sp.]